MKDEGIGVISLHKWMYLERKLQPFYFPAFCEMRPNRHPLQ